MLTRKAPSGVAGVAFGVDAAAGAANGVVSAAACCRSELHAIEEKISLDPNNSIEPHLL